MNGTLTPAQELQQLLECIREIVRSNMADSLKLRAIAVLVSEIG